MIPKEFAQVLALVHPSLNHRKDIIDFFAPMGLASNGSIDSKAFEVFSASVEDFDASSDKYIRGNFSVTCDDATVLSALKSAEGKPFQVVNDDLNEELNATQIVANMGITQGATAVKAWYEGVLGKEQNGLFLRSPETDNVDVVKLEVTIPFGQDDDDDHIFFVHAPKNDSSMETILYHANGTADGYPQEEVNKVSASYFRQWVETILDSGAENKLTATEGAALSVLTTLHENANALKFNEVQMDVSAEFTDVCIGSKCMRIRVDGNEVFFEPMEPNEVVGRFACSATTYPYEYVGSWLQGKLDAYEYAPEVSKPEEPTAPKEPEKPGEKPGESGEPGGDHHECHCEHSETVIIESDNNKSLLKGGIIGFLAGVAVAK